MDALSLGFWEVALAAMAWAVSGCIARGDTRLIWFLLCDIVFALIPASVFCFARVNNTAGYLVYAVVLLAALGLVPSLRRGFAVAGVGRLSWGAAALSLPFVGLTLASIRPVQEVDSLYNLHFLLQWLSNAANPYEFAFHYVPFWELSVFPTLALTRGDSFFWIASAKAVALLAAILYSIGKSLALRGWVLRVSLVSAMAFPFLWFPASGVSTLKNDMLHAAGEALLALVLLRAGAEWDREQWGLATAACVLLSVKFSGPVFLVCGGAVLAVLLPKWVWRKRWAILAGFGVWMIAVGHYYLHNAFAFGNPFYPFQINVGPIRLPGLGDLSATSILYSLHDVRLWRAFFWPEGLLSPAGILFPVVLVAILLGFGVLGVRELAAGRWSTGLAIALFELLTWGLYFRSVYSASAQPGDLMFVLSRLNSLRYVEGALLVAEIYFTAWLARAGVPSFVLIPLLAVQGLSRFWLLWREGGGSPAWWMIAAAAGLVIVAVRFPRWALAGLFAGALGVSPRLTEQRSAWLPQWQALYKPLWTAPATSIFLVVDGENSEQAVLHFPMEGERLQHRVVSGTYSDLSKQREPMQYVVRMRRADRNLESKVVAPELIRREYERLVDVSEGVLYKRLTATTRPAEGLPKPQ